MYFPENHLHEKTEFDHLLIQFVSPKLTLEGGLWGINRGGFVTQGSAAAAITKHNPRIPAKGKMLLDNVEIVG